MTAKILMKCRYVFVGKCVICKKKKGNVSIILFLIIVMYIK